MNRKADRAAALLAPTGHPNGFWVVARCRGGDEQRADRALRDRHGALECWWPTETRRRSYRGRVRSWTAPVVAGYLFVCLVDWPDFERLRDEIPLVDFVRTNGSLPVVVDQKSMLQMQQLPARLAEIARIEEERRRIRPGDSVEITHGPFEGSVLRVETVAGRNVVCISPLGRVTVRHDRAKKQGT